MSVTMPAIRVTRSVYDRIQALAQEQHEPMGAVIERLITQEEERRFWEETNAAYYRFLRNTSRIAGWKACATTERRQTVHQKSVSDS